MLKAFFKLVDREGKVKIDDLVKEFRGYYVQRASEGQPLERSASPLSDPTRPSDHEIKRLIITYPLERFLIKNFMEYFSEEGVLRMAPQLWQALHYYEVVDTLKMADEQNDLYVARQYLLSVISQEDPRWLKKPIGIIGMHWESDGQPSACFLINMAQMLYVIDHGIVTKSIPRLQKKFRDLLRSPDEQFDRILSLPLIASKIFLSRMAPGQG